MESSEVPPRTDRDTPSTREPLSTADLARAGFIGDSPIFREAVNKLNLFSTTDLPLLILGETGTGKEVAARAVHRWSGRRGDLVDVNCGALPGELVEGELFGHRREAFTGAREDRPGLIEAAQNGTLFLDEVGSLTPAAQAKLLRVLEAGEVRRLGDTRNRKVHFRLVAAGHAHLLNDRRHSFRYDLLSRIGGAVLTLPPLRERGGDAELLADHFARLRNTTVAAACGSLLRNHPWRGNIRELRDAINRAAILAPGAVITPEVLERALALGAMAPDVVPPPSNPALAARHAYLRERITQRWSVTMIARESGVNRSTVYRWLREHHLHIPRGT